MDDGARTHDNRNHNPGLYQLSYDHHWIACLVHKCTASEPRIIRGFVYSGKCFRWNQLIWSNKKSPQNLRANIRLGWEYNKTLTTDVTINNGLFVNGVYYKFLRLCCSRYIRVKAVSVMGFKLFDWHRFSIKVALIGMAVGLQ